MVVLGVHWQNVPSSKQDLVQGHQSSLPLYLSLIVGEWLLVYFVWFGLQHGRKIKVKDLIGGRWVNWKKILIDIGIGISFWIVWIGVEKIVISVFGVFYGVLSIWRKSLRPNMVAHAWGDIFSGILSRFL